MWVRAVQVRARVVETVKAKIAGGKKGVRMMTSEGCHLV